MGKACKFQLASNAISILNKGTTMPRHLTQSDRLGGARISFSYISSGISPLVGVGILAEPYG